MVLNRSPQDSCWGFRVFVHNLYSHMLIFSFPFCEGMNSAMLIWSFCRETIIELVHEISSNVVCEASKASDQPAHTRSLIRAFASRLSIL